MEIRTRNHSGHSGFAGKSRRDVGQKNDPLQPDSLDVGPGSGPVRPVSLW